MSDEVKVTLASDDGFKRRWGLSNILYRKEGTKQSINTKMAAGLFGSIMLMGVGYSIASEFFKTTPSENLAPIGFNEQVSSDAALVIPRGDSEMNRPSTTKPQTKERSSFSGLQVIERPNLGKIPPGTMVRAKFITGASNGPLKAILIEPLVVNGEEIAHEGESLVGIGSSNDDRLIVQFGKLVSRDGTFKGIQAQACDMSDQMVGVKGKKLSKHAIMMATGAGLNFLGGMAEGLQETQGQNGAVVKKNDMRNAALNGASKATLDQSQEILTSIRNKKAIIQVDSGTEFLILFEGE